MVDRLWRDPRFARLGWLLLILWALTGVQILLGLPAAYDGSDLRVGQEAAMRLLDGRPLFGWDLAASGQQPLFFHYSPAAAAVFTAFLPLGSMAVAVWRIATVIALLAALGPRIGLLVICSAPIVVDLYTCNGTGLALALIVVMLRRPTSVRLFAVALMIFLAPRTPFVPVLAFILVVERGWWPVALAGAIVGAASLAIGQVPDYALAVLGSTSEIFAPANIGPSSYVGGWWLVVSIPVAAGLTLLACRWRDRTVLGAAMVFMAPYWFLATLTYFVLGPITSLGARGIGPQPVLEPAPVPTGLPSPAQS